MPPTEFAALAAAPAPASPPPRSERSDGYFGSSFDLQAGLEVRLVHERHLAPDVQRELARLRAVWSAAAPRGPGRPG